MENDITASVLCITYNHEKYISQAIESLLSQKTDFPFEIVIADDASTDRNQEIIQGYADKHPDLIRPILRKHNIGPGNNWLDAFRNCRGKYVALCEGDDFWTDPHKLQRQVDFLEKNEGCPVCFTNSLLVDGVGKTVRTERVPPERKKNLSQLEIISGYCPPSNTMMFRNGLIKEFPESYAETVNGDFFLYVLLTDFGDAAYLDFVSGAYRLHSGGAWWSKSDLYHCQVTLRTLQAFLKVYADKYGDLLSSRIEACVKELAGYSSSSEPAKGEQPATAGSPSAQDDRESGAQGGLPGRNDNGVPVKNVVISGTNFWNPGDDFVREGVVKILRTLFPNAELNFLFYNFNQDFFPQSKFSGTHNMLSKGDLEAFRDSVDYIVIAGLSAGDEIKDLYNWILQNGLEDRVYMIGAGYENDYVAKHILEEPEGTIFRNAKIITGRTKKVPPLIRDLALPYHYINCPAILSADEVKKIDGNRKIERIALSLQLPHEVGVTNHSCERSMYELGLQVFMELKDRYEIDLIAHHKSEYFHFLDLFRRNKLPNRVRFSSFYRDLFDVYPEYDLVITTRLHASLFANGFGIPGIIINSTDRHVHTLEGFPHSTWVDSIQKFHVAFDSLKAKSLSGIADEARQFKSCLLGKYVETLSSPFGVNVNGEREPSQTETKASSGDVPVHFFTIVLNGKPFIEYHLNVLKDLPFKWHWHIMEGVAELKHDTGWSVANGGRITDGLHKNGLSNDGTTEYIDSIKSQFPERVTVYRKEGGAFWDGKLEMVNRPLENINEECILWQIDSDELWTRDQILKVRELFIKNPAKTAALYYCSYFVGDDKVISTKDTYGNHTGYEWLRTWRYMPGDKWRAHEPPQLYREFAPDVRIDLGKANPFTHAETEERGLVFQHFAYSTESQLRFKESYYGYENALKDWNRLNDVKSLPVLLKDFLPWVDEGAIVDRGADLGIIPLASAENGTWKFDARQDGSPAGHKLKSHRDYLLDAENAINAGDLEPARKILTLLIRAFDDNTDAKNDLAIVEMLEHNYGDAVALLDSILVEEPENAIARANRDAIDKLQGAVSDEERPALNPDSTQQPAEIRKVLLVRPDSIGDNVIFSAMLPFIRESYAGATIAVVCQEHIAELYSGNSNVDTVFAFNRARMDQDGAYQRQFLVSLQEFGADLALNTVFSREPMTDFITLGSNAKYCIAFRGDLSNMKADDKKQFDAYYNRLIETKDDHITEFSRMTDFLDALGIHDPELKLSLSISAEDDAFAERAFGQHGLNPSSTIAIFPKAQYSVKEYPHFSKVLEELCNTGNYSFIGLGSENDFETVESILSEIPPERKLNLSGRTTLLQSAAILKRSSLALGVDTAAAHLACAVGTPNVVILGGGHFGRFLPYSSLTSVVSLPLDCYGCNWKCEFQVSHCTTDISPEVITEAVRQTLSIESERPRIFVQGEDVKRYSTGEPKWQWFDDFKEPEDVEIITVGKTPSWPSSEDKLLRAETEIQSGNLVKGRAILNSLLRKDPDSINALNDLAVVEINENNFQKALEILTKVSVLDPSNEVAGNNLRYVEGLRHITVSAPGSARSASRLTFSVITPSFNQGKFIEQTIKSVLAQDYPDFEHIVIDGGSTDETIEILKKYPHLIWVSEKDKGQSDALNKGLARAKGDIIAWINSDDWYEPETFRTVAKFFEENKSKNVVMGDCNLVDQDGNIFDHVVNMERGFEELKNYRVPRSIPTQPAIFFRRKLLQESGGVDVTLKYTMDYDLWMRFARTERFFHIGRTFANYRFHMDAKIGDMNWDKIYPECEIVRRRYVSPAENQPVSVIIPCYNYARYLPECVASVAAQTYQNLEIIIVNDGSKDNTSGVARTLIDRFPHRKIKLIDKSNGGAASARNRGIRESSGKYILPLDADDLIAPEMVEECLKVLESDPNVAIAYTDQVYLENGKQRIVRTEEYDFEKLKQANLLSYCSMYRRDVWEKVGGYRELMDDPLSYEDWDFWLAAGSLGFKGKHLPLPLFYYRVKEDGRYHLQESSGFDKHRAQIVLAHKESYREQEVELAKQTLNVSLQTSDAGNHRYAVNPDGTLYHPEYPDFQVTAIIAAYNEEDVIYYAIKDLIDNGINVYLIDHHSTDATVREASKLFGKGLLKIETFPEDSGFRVPNDVYSWRYILQRKEQIARELGHAWYIHADADEFRESPFPNLNLREAIKYVDSLEFNAIEFALLDFYPVDNSFQRGDVREYIHYYKGGKAFNSRQLKAWKNLGVPAVLNRTGGHEIEFEGRRVFPVPFVLRHYPIRSEAHARKKIYRDRFPRFDEVERKNGWHIQYDNPENPGYVFSQSELKKHDAKEVRETLLAETLKTLLALMVQTNFVSAVQPNVFLAVADQIKKGVATDLAPTAVPVPGGDTPTPKTAMPVKPEGHEIPVLIQRAEKFILDKQYGAAEGALKEFLKSDPENTDGLNDLCVVNIIQGKYGDALALLKKVISLDPKNTIAQGNLNMLLQQVNQKAEAMKSKASPLANVDVGESISAAERSIQSRDYATAERTLTEVLAKVPFNVDALNDLAVVEILLGRKVEADSLLKRVLEADPDNEVALGNLKILRQSFPEQGADTVDGHNAGQVGELSSSSIHEPGDAVDKQLVSIVIPVFNQVEYTRKCVAAIVEHTIHPNYEVIIINNASTDGTREFLDKLVSGDGHFRAIHSTENLGFVDGCNRAAAEGKGKYILFLNNDAEVQHGWLRPLVDLAESREDFGAAGSMLLYPDGTVQEAGGIVFSDGSGWNFGRGSRPDDPMLRVIREVDYCSGASLMVRGDLFRKYGGFDTRYAPAYSEDADLCFTLRKDGYKVFYDPRSVVIHNESVTSGKDNNSGFKRYLEINRKKFVEKWKDALLEQDEAPFEDKFLPVTPDRNRLVENHGRSKFAYRRNYIFNGIPDRAGNILPYYPTLGGTLQADMPVNILYDPNVLLALSESLGFPWLYGRAYAEGRVLCFRQREMLKHVNDELRGDLGKAGQLVTLLGPKQASLLRDIMNLEVQPEPGRSRSFIKSEGVKLVGTNALKELYRVAVKYAVLKGVFDVATGVTEIQGMKNMEELIAENYTAHMELPLYVQHRKELVKKFRYSSEGEGENGKLKVLCFFPHNPYPPRTGADHGFLGVLDALHELGCDVRLFSSTYFTDKPWKFRDVEALCREKNISLYVHQADEDDHIHVSVMKLLGQSKMWDMKVTQSLREAFVEVYREVSPDIVLINYGWWGKLINDINPGSAVTILQMHDLLSLNEKMQNAARELVGYPPYDFDRVRPEALVEDVFARLNLDGEREEYDIYDKYDYVLAVSDREVGRINENAPHTRMVLIPAPLGTNNPARDNSYSGYPLLAIGDNVFNVQAYLYFVKKVLPLVRKEIPGFQVNVVGDGCRILNKADGVNLLGFVDDLSSIYSESCFAIAPMLGGTGQSVKILEAMANGLPVVSLNNSYQASAVRDGENGFVASSAEGFAAKVIRLFKDRGLCRELGSKARMNIEAEFSHSRIVDALRPLVASASESKEAPEVQKNESSRKVVVQEITDELAAEGIIAPYIERVEGNLVFVKDSILEPAGASPFDVLDRFLKALPSYYGHFGGIGDALLLLSTFYDDNPEQTVVSFANSREAMRRLFGAFDKLKKVYLVAKPTQHGIHKLTRLLMRRSGKCLGMGTTPLYDYSSEWNDNVDIFEQYRVKRNPKWISQFQTRKSHEFQVTIQPKGSVCGMVGSKRNVIDPANWSGLLKTLRDRSIKPIIVGMPDEREEYPALSGCIDERSSGLVRQIELVASSDLVIGADSWAKTLSALKQTPAIVFRPVRGKDLENWEDPADNVFIKPWPSIHLVGGMGEFGAVLANLFPEPPEDTTAGNDIVPENRRGGVGRSEDLNLKGSGSIRGTQGTGRKKARRPVGDLSEKLAVNWEGSQFVHHSMALINREITLQLIGQGHEVSIIPYEKDEYNHRMDKRYAQIARRVNKKQKRPLDIHVRHQWPPNLVPPPDGHWVMIQPWEFGSLPKDWIAVMNDSVDEVWVPSTYVRDCYVKSGLDPKRIAVVPNGVNTERFSPKARPYRLKTKKKFKFLFVGGTITRKGIDILLNAYVKSFTRNDDVCLVIKDLLGNSFYKGQTIEEDLKRISADASLPEIEYINEKLTEEQIAGLYTAADCLVHPYRGEGFGLPIAEALSSELPVIVTNYGAALDFCNEDNSYLIPSQVVYYQEKKVGKRETVNEPWLAEPDQSAAGELMRRVFNSYTEAKEKARRGRKLIVESFSWEKAGKLVEERMIRLRDRPIKRFDSDGGADNQPKYRLAQVLIDSGDRKSAANLLKELLDSDSDNVNVANDLAVLYSMDGKASDAEKVLTEIVERHPENTLAKKNLATLYSNQGKIEQALPLYQDVLKSTPFDTDVFISLGQISLRLGNTVQAKEFFNLVVQKDPGNIQVRRLLEAIESIPEEAAVK